MTTDSLDRVSLLVMAEQRELPEMVTELVDLSRSYVDEEIVVPAKQLGRYTGVSVLAGAVVSLGVVLLAVAAFRGLAMVLPEGAYWSALAYVVVALVMVGLAFLIVRRTATKEPQ